MAIRESQDVVLGAEKPTTSNIRESQDVVLGAEKPTTTNIRESQDIVLVAVSALTHVRESQDVILAIFVPAPVTFVSVDISQPINPRRRTPIIIHRFTSGRVTGNGKKSAAQFFVIT